MNDYTPTTEEVRSAYHYYGKYPELAPDDNTVTGAEFDRWLRQVKAEAWAEGAQSECDYNWRCDEAQAAGLGVMIFRPKNPYLSGDNS